MHLGKETQRPIALKKSYRDRGIFLGLRHIARIMAHELVLKALRRVEDPGMILHRQRLSCRERAQRLNTCPVIAPSIPVASEMNDGFSEDDLRMEAE